MMDFSEKELDEINQKFAKMIDADIQEPMIEEVQQPIANQPEN